MIEVSAEMPANVWKVLVEVGQTVKDGDELVILESMKMEIPVASPCHGRVVGIPIAEGEAVQEGQVLVTVEQA